MLVYESIADSQSFNSYYFNVFNLVENMLVNIFVITCKEVT